MKRPTALIAILLIVVVLIAVLGLRLFLKDDAAPQESAPPPTAPPTSAPVTAAPETPTAAPETPAPTAPPPPTPSPTEPPIETHEPIVTPSPTPMKADGSFRSNTGTGLNLVVDWAVTGGDGESASVTFVYYAESYSFYCSPLYNSLELTANGETHAASSPNISYDGKDQIRTQLASFTVTLPRGQNAVSAVWHYRGTYSKTELEDITASATITLN